VTRYLLLERELDQCEHESSLTHYWLDDKSIFHNANQVSRNVARQEYQLMILTGSLG
jgi:hypothetical protein